MSERRDLRLEEQLASALCGAKQRTFDLAAADILHYDAFAGKFFGKSHGNHLAAGFAERVYETYAPAAPLPCRGDAPHGAGSEAVADRVCCGGPAADVVGPGAAAVQAVVGYDPRVVVLREHQRAPRLVDGRAVAAGAACQRREGAELLGSHDAVFGMPHLAGDALQHLAAPHEADADILLRHAVILGLRVRGDALEVFTPGNIGRMVADRVARADPGAVAPPGILVTHADRAGDALPGAGFEVLRAVAPGGRLPDGTPFERLAGVARHGADRASVGCDPVDGLPAEGGPVAAPAGVRALERGVSESEETENLRQAAREAGLLDGVGRELHVGEVAADLAHAVVELADEALARDVVAVGLGVGRVGELHARVGGQPFESCVVARRAHGDGVPRLGLDLQADAPLGMGLQLVADEAGLPPDGIVAVDAAVVSVGEVGRTLRGKRISEEQQRSEEHLSSDGGNRQPGRFSVRCLAGTNAKQRCSGADWFHGVSSWFVGRIPAGSTHTKKLNKPQTAGHRVGKVGEK